MKLCKKQNKIPNTSVLKEHEFKEARNLTPFPKPKKSSKLQLQKRKEKGNNKKRKQWRSVHPFSR